MAAFAASSNSSPNSPTFAPGILIAWLICNGRKRSPVGGWLFFFYWQLYSGLLISAVFFAGNIQSYVPENFDTPSQFALFMASSVPGLVLFAVKCVNNIGLETVGIAANEHGVPVDSHMRVHDRLWAIGDVTGIWPLTHVGKYQGEVAASNILGEQREVNYEAVPRAVFTDPQAAAVGATEARFAATAALKEVAKTATYTVAYAESNGFLTLLSDGDRLTGAYALGPEAGEWLQQATLAIRARVPLAVLGDTIQPFSTFSEIFVDALHALHVEVRTAVSAPLATETRP
jgi:Pyridine nucleotide-disulphide oxidoreductase, dimerisation domain